MKTFEGRKIDSSCPLSKYPTPQFRRDSYLSLNGFWDFALDKKPFEGTFREKILVPFSVETPLSSITRHVEKDDVMTYRRFFSLPEGFRSYRVLLHFEAIDQIADIYLNGVYIAHHEGGYLPFTVDCLELKDGINELRVLVKDDTDSDVFPRGKQMNKRGGIWYTPTSGIWGSVWLESVPNQVIQSLRIEPDFDNKNVKIAAKFEGKMLTSQVIVSFNGKIVGEGELNEKLTCVIPLKNLVRPWSPSRPDLYDVRVRINEDEVSSYFGLRKFSSVEVDGHRVFALNNEPLFLSGVLDQGYYPDGGLTPPTDKAMIDDIASMKELGFNCLRKHIKIEPMRWYYHCDKLGMIVIQDMVNGGGKYNPLLIMTAPFISYRCNDTKQYHKLGRKNPESRKCFEETLGKTVDRLFNCPCIAIWTLFNEGWGQFDAARLTALLKDLDPTRLIDSTSGWFDQGVGDFDSRHVYFRRFKPKKTGDRILALTEFGGYSLRVANHVYSKFNFGYTRVKNQERLAKKIQKLYREQIIPAKKGGLSVAIYTQLSDVEDETNGFLTYDRKVSKVKTEVMKKINEELIGK